MSESFPQRVPLAFQTLIDEGCAEVARQVLVSPEEERVRPEELADPIGDSHFSAIKGITHRYEGRVLLKPLMRCALHCRFCFRREVVNTDGSDLTPEELEKAIAYIAEHKDICEVILTGGDPLLLPDHMLTSLLGRLAALDHIKILRIHTRIPVAMPERVQEKLAKILSSFDKVVWLVVHTNCAAELTPTARQALSTLRRHGVPLLSQSVLLRGVNDSLPALESLFTNLINLGVKPYYLHYPDLVRGTSHFRIPLEEALKLVQGLSERISGLAIPRLCLDLPRGLGKVFPAATPFERTPSGAWILRSPLTGEKVAIDYSQDL